MIFELLRQEKPVLEGTKKLDSFFTFFFISELYPRPFLLKTAFFEPNSVSIFSLPLVKFDNVFSRYSTCFSSFLQFSQVFMDACRHVNSRLTKSVLALCHSSSRALTLGSNLKANHNKTNESMKDKQEKV